MSSIAIPRASLADLAKTEGKAELIAGRIVHFMATGYRPNRIAGRIFRSLDDFAEASGQGIAFTDNIGYAIPEISSGRESFSPDASYYLGGAPENEMSFVEGAPVFAVEVRGENNYGTAADHAMASKRADYFEAGTQVVWDVDPIANTIRSYRAETPEEFNLFTPGQLAHAEPALAGWRIDVEQLFRP